jgi:hypothetical protein
MTPSLGQGAAVVATVDSNLGLTVDPATETAIATAITK